MKIRSVIPVLLASLAPRLAAADSPPEPTVVDLVPTCAAIDAGDDLKDDAARAAARRLLAWTLEQQDLLVVDSGCAETFKVSHRHQRGSVMVVMTSERGTWTWQNAKVEELPAVYRTLVTSLLHQPTTSSGVPAGSSPTTAGNAPTDRTSDPTTSGPVAGMPQLDEAPMRTAPPPAPFGAGTLEAAASGPEKPARISLWYLRLGAGGAGGIESGATGAIGWRRLVGSYAVDISLAGMGNENGSFTRGAFQVLGFRSDKSPIYYGGGIALESVRVGPEFGMNSTGGGLGLAASVGLALNRDSSRGQAFLQADVGLPLYQVNGAFGDHYPASFGMSFGFGFGRR